MHSKFVTENLDQYLESGRKTKEMKLQYAVPYGPVSTGFLSLYFTDISVIYSYQLGNLSLQV